MRQYLTNIVLTHIGHKKTWRVHVTRDARAHECPDGEEDGAIATGDDSSTKRNDSYSQWKGMGDRPYGLGWWAE